MDKKIQDKIPKKKRSANLQPKPTQHKKQASGGQKQRKKARIKTFVSKNPEENSSGPVENSTGALRATGESRPPFRRISKGGSKSSSSRIRREALRQVSLSGTEEQSSSRNERAPSPPEVLVNFLQDYEKTSEKKKKATSKERASSTSKKQDEATPGRLIDSHVKDSALSSSSSSDSSSESSDDESDNSWEEVKRTLDNSNLSTLEKAKLIVALESNKKKPSGKKRVTPKESLTPPSTSPRAESTPGSSTSPASSRDRTTDRESEETTPRADETSQSRHDREDPPPEDISNLEFDQEEFLFDPDEPNRSDGETPNRVPSPVLSFSESRRRLNPSPDPEWEEREALNRFDDRPADIINKQREQEREEVEKLLNPPEFSEGEEEDVTLDAS